MKPMTIDFKNGVVVPITKKEAIRLSIDPTKDKKEFYLKTRGPWNIILKLSGLAVEYIYEPGEIFNKKSKIIIYGERTLSRPRQMGYAMHGHVSIDSKREGAFTTTQLFEVEGKLIDVAVLRIVKKQEDV